MNGGLLRVFFVTTILVYILSPYCTSTVLTQIKQGDLQAVCGEGRVVVLSYTHMNESGEIYCLYTDASQNSRLKISKEKGVWKESFRENISKKFYWPFFV